MKIPYMNIIGRRKIWFTLSLILLIPGIISLAFQGLNLGIDFTGGSLIHFQTEQPAGVDQVRGVLDQFGLGSSVVQPSENNNMLIRTKALDKVERDQLVGALEADLGKITVQRDENVGPVIGKELSYKAFLALGIAAVLMILYITLRFEFKFGLAAVLALLHDIVILVGIFSIFQIEVDGTFVAAVLTVLGYSINDTIVIFDRIRENMGPKKRKGESLEAMANRSVLETMTRSINTVLTVIFMLAALIFWGGETTRVFSMAILIGVVIGAYASIFNAAPLWVVFKNWEKAQRQKPKVRVA
ncbi:MAG: protein translocase subunit SecF [Heliobacteriaceae bacterium]|nr:protein translocase subunit SecF [Heliobacteriaceae bacterium]MDD4587113.1 protein translocase subunit SecF [Heliobacteriaceae bacterium]